MILPSGAFCNFVRINTINKVVYGNEERTYFTVYCKEFPAF